MEVLLSHGSSLDSSNQVGATPLCLCSSLKARQLCMDERWTMPRQALQAQLQQQLLKQEEEERQRRPGPFRLLSMTARRVQIEEPLFPETEDRSPRHSPAPGHVHRAHPVRACRKSSDFLQTCLESVHEVRRARSWHQYHLSRSLEQLALAGEEGQQAAAAAAAPAAAAARWLSGSPELCALSRSTSMRVRAREAAAAFSLSPTPPHSSSPPPPHAHAARRASLCLPRDGDAGPPPPASHRRKSVDCMPTCVSPPPGRMTPAAAAGAAAHALLRSGASAAHVPGPKSRRPSVTFAGTSPQLLPHAGPRSSSPLDPFGSLNPDGRSSHGSSGRPSMNLTDEATLPRLPTPTAEAGPRSIQLLVPPPLRGLLKGLDQAAGGPSPAARRYEPSPDPTWSGFVTQFV